MKTIRTTGARAAVVVSALALALTACSSGGSSDDTSASASTDYEQPASGIPSSYEGTLPMPDPAQAYDNPQERDNVKDGGTLTLPIGEVTANWNQFSTDGNTAYMADLWQFYQPQLWTYDVAGTPTPNPDYLTNVEVTSEDPLVVTYDINPDAKWNDGTDIDWTAFEATWYTQSGKNEGFNPPSTSGYDSVASVEQGDSPKQAVVTFETPFYPYQFLFLQLEHPKNKDPEFFTQGWVNEPHNELAAGPFVVESHDETQVTFVPNENWWGDAPKLEKVVFKQMEPTAQINAFQNGEIDAVEVTTADNVKIVRAMDDVEIRRQYATQTGVFELNGQAEALKDINVRKAVVQATDVKQLSDIKFHGIDWTEEEAGSELLFPFQDGYEDNMPEEAAYSVENAKATLEEAGFTLGDDGYYAKDGKTLEIRYTYFGDNATQTAIANAFQAMQKQAGIKVEIDNQDASKFSDVILGGQYDVVIMAWSSSDPYSYSTSGSQLYSQVYPPEGSNFTFVGSDEIDELMKVPGTIEDIDEAIAAANKAEKVALELYGTVPLNYGPEQWAVKQGLANWGPSGFKRLNFNAEDIGWQS